MRILGDELRGFIRVVGSDAYACLNTDTGGPPKEREDEYDSQTRP